MNLKTYIWKLIVSLYRKISHLRSLIFIPFFKKVGSGFGIETNNFRISGIKNISIGNNFSLTHGCVLMGEGGIEIGDNVLIGPYSQLYSANHGCDNKKPISKQKSTYSKIIIEDDVWIGANSIILKGIKIGKGAIIGAGSIVTKNIPAYTVYAGNPAKFIRKR